MLSAVALLGLVVAAAEPVGFREQCAKQLWVTYRSFNKELERTGQFGAMGVTNRCFFAANTINSMGQPYCEYPLIWKEFGSYDWTALDAQVQELVNASPNARFMCMIDLNTPYWATHKFHLDSFTDVTHAACDPQWRTRTKKWMLDFIAYAEKRWGDRIGAYILSGGGTSEWYEYDRGRTSRNKDAAWVRWCRAKGLDYGESVPSAPSLGRAAFENLVYDPKGEAAKIEYWKFHNSLPAGAILEFAAAARPAIPKTKEVGVFFGYFLVSDAKHTSFGHLDYQRVFASPDIDFFIAPGNYSDRGIGGSSGSQLVHGTALRHGKRFLHEIDFGPHDQKRWGSGTWKTLADDLAGNTREAAFAMANNANYWWFDMWGGFYRNPAVRARIAALKKVQDALKPAPSAAEILLVVDPESMYHVNERCPLERAFGQHLRNDGKRLDAARVEDWAGVPFKTPGVSVTPQKGWRSVYAYDYKLYSPATLARLIAEAGVHRYVDECAPVFATENFVAVHVVKGGPREVRLPRTVKTVTDLLTGKVLATDVDRFTCPFDTPDTKLLGLDF